MRMSIAIATCLFLVLAPVAAAQTAFPMAGKVDRARFRDHCDRLFQALKELKSPLSADTERALKTLLCDNDKDAEDFSADVQKLLDPYCLLAVSINPESRVKAVRGPAAAELRQGEEMAVLVKVVNEAGVTGAMAVAGPQIRRDGRAGLDQWLEAAVVKASLGKGLSGEPLQYLLLRLKARESGKREATLKFDVGQGTQDLGFRAEVPVLFTVRPAERQPQPTEPRSSSPWRVKQQAARPRARSFLGSRSITRRAALERVRGHGRLQACPGGLGPLRPPLLSARSGWSPRGQGSGVESAALAGPAARHVPSSPTAPDTGSPRPSARSR
jgi:hypothetical protein